MNELSAVKPLQGDLFSDTLDGYFPLSVSIQQMMERNCLDTVWFMLTHAPFIDTPDLADTDTVPFSLKDHLSGLFQAVTLIGAFSDRGFYLEGSGDWFREGKQKSNRPLTGGVRLGEPAYITGFGISSKRKDRKDTRASVAIADFTTSKPSASSLRDAADQLGWKAARAYSLAPHHERLTLAPEIEASEDPDGAKASIVSILSGNWSHILAEVFD